MHAEMVGIDLGWGEARNFHDERRDGYVCIREGSRSAGRDHYIRLADLAERLPYWEGRNDVFISQGSFSRPWRSNETVRGLQLVYSDLDSYAVEGLPILSPESQANRVLIFCDDVGLPPPSLIVFSGRGVQCKWLLAKTLPGGGAMVRWRAVQEAIFAALRPLGADAAARSPSQIFRLAGSVNSKTGSVVRVLFQNTNPTHGGEMLPTGVVGYDFDMLADEILSVNRATARATKAATAARQKKAAEQAAEHEAGAFMATVLATGTGAHHVKHRKGAQAKYRASYAGLAQDRLRDLYKLAAMRWPTGGAPAGKRDILVFLAACFLAGCTVAVDLEREIFAAAAKLSPKWSKADVKSCTSSVLSRSQRHAAGEVTHFNGHVVPVGYRWTNQTLVELLEITADEQQKLTTIIGRAEVLRRKRTKKVEAARAIGVQSRTEYLSAAQDRATRARELKAAGETISSIAVSLGVSIRTAQSYCAGGVARLHAK